MANDMTISLTKKLLAYAGVSSAAAAEAIAEQALHISAGDNTLRDFSKWCASSEAPPAVRLLDKRWHELFFWSAWRCENAARDEARHNDPSISFLFPYRYISASGCRVRGHQALDRLAASSADPIWEDLRMPLGWLCSCSVVAVMEGDPEVSPDADATARGRIAPELLASCIAWSERPPIEALKILS